MALELERGEGNGFRCLNCNIIGITKWNDGTLTVGFLGVGVGLEKLKFTPVKIEDILPEDCYFRAWA